MRSARALAVAVLGVLALLGLQVLPAAGQGRARCVVVEGSDAGPISTGAARPASVDVVVPRLRCSGRDPGRPVTGSGGGSALGDGHGRLPYTGFELEGALQLAAVLILAGLVLVATTPRRREARAASEP